MDVLLVENEAPPPLAVPDLSAVLAATGMSSVELSSFCAIVVAVLEQQHEQARGMAVYFWRSGHSQLLWAPEIRRFVVRAGPWALGCPAPTLDDVLYVEDALGLTEDGPAQRAWLGELTRAWLATAPQSFAPSWLHQH